MPFLTIESTNVDVAGGAVQVDPITIGERSRSFDGTMRSTVRAYKQVWNVTTAPLTRTAADTLEGVLQGAQPLTATGDLVGSSTEVHIEYQGRTTAPGTGGDELVRISFRMHEE